MIGQREAATWARRVGVAVEQIERDHLVSHVLAALPAFGAGPDLVFLGGTALARTHLDGLRVSEDIDLLVTGVGELAASVREGLARLLRRDYPDLHVGSAIRAARGRKFQLAATGAPLVELQLLEQQREESRLPFESRPVSLRYRGLPTHVELTVPTAESFFAMKVAAYRDRHEPRDLFDLAHLPRVGAVTRRSLGLVLSLTGAPCDPREFQRLPRHTATTWHERLAHQTGQLLAPEEALQLVREAVETVQP
jgi:predicted nucleotidyltransferase component of viral defense system